MISIRTKLLIPVSIISLLMMAITAVYIYSRYQAYETYTETHTEQKVTQLKHALSDIFLHTSSLVENIASNRIVIDSLLLNNQYDVLENLTQYIEQENLDKLVIYTKKGEIFAQIDNPSRFGHTDHLYPWLLELRNGSDSKCIADMKNDVHTLLCGNAIDSVNGVIGYAVAGYHVNQQFITLLQERTSSQLRIDQAVDLAQDDDFKVTHLNLLEEGLIQKQQTPFYLSLVEDLSDQNKQRDHWIIYSFIIVALNIAVISFLFIFVGMISKAILSLNKYARHVEDRDFSYNYEPKRRPSDEIGQIIESFYHIAESYKEFTGICESIAAGDIDRNIEITHTHDNLGVAVNNMITCLREKTANNVKALSDLNTLNEQLKVVQQRSEKASEEKSIFLATMSHEIRTALNGIVGMVHKLGHGKLDPNQAQQLEITKICSDHLLAVIDDILDFSKIEAGKMDLNTESVDLKLLLENLIGLFINNARESNIDLFYHVAPKIPDIIHVDPTRLRQVLTNLLSNAFKFTKAGKILIKVSLQQSNMDKLQLLFMVEDSGIGIAEDKKPLLFKPFMQADTSISRRYGGTGLGLTICARLVNLMGGNIWLDEKTSSGSTFYFTVDVGRETEQYPSQLRALYPDLQAKKVIIITNNDGSCGQVLHQRLVDLGMTVAAIETPERSLTDKSMIPDIDVILLILERTSSQTWQYISALRNHHHRQDLPIIMFVNYDDGLLQHSDNHLCIRLDKPLLHHELVEKLLSLFSVESTAISPPENPHRLVRQYQARILVVDDNIMNQYVILHLLQDTGCKVNTSSNGYEALELLKKLVFDIIFIDIHMPDIDGLTLAGNIAEYYSNKKAPWMIAMTADTSTDIRNKSLEAGMMDVVTKPVLLDKLDYIFSQWQQEYNSNDLSLLEMQSSPCLLDLGILDKYRLVILEGLCALFNKSGLEYIEKLNISEKQGDIEQIIQIAHMFKGSALTMGASHLSELCAELQIVSKRNQLGAISGTIDKVTQCYSKTVVELERHVEMKKYMLSYR